MLLKPLMLLLVTLHDLLVSSHLLVMKLTMPAVHFLSFSTGLAPLVHGSREELVDWIL